MDRTDGLNMLNFAKAMFQRLETKAEKYKNKEWTRMDLKELRESLYQHEEELGACLRRLDSPDRSENIKRECLDIANYALFIYLRS